MTEYDLIEIEKYLVKQANREVCCGLELCIISEHEKEQKLHLPTIKFHQQVEQLISEYRQSILCSRPSSLASKGTGCVSP